MNIDDYISHFQIDKNIGASHYSRVYLATEISTGRQVALKVLVKAPMDGGAQKYYVQQPDYDYDGLISVYDLFEDDEMLIVVLDFVPKLDLVENLISSPKTSEAKVAELSKHILHSLKFLHENGIIHRNLKPENILINDSDSEHPVILSDYFFALTIESNPHLLDLSSTEACSSPEILQGAEYGPSTDIWSLGVIIYMLLSGRRPFEEDDKFTLSQKVLEGKINFSLPVWESISENGKDLISKMLQVDSYDRISIDEALEHPWFNEAPTNEIEGISETLQLTMMGRRLKTTLGAAKSASFFKPFSKLSERSDN